MPIEPPVASPHDLAEAYATLGRGGSGTPARPLAGGTDLLVALTGELGRAAGQRARPVGHRWPARHRHRRRHAQPRRPDDVPRDPPLGAVPRARPGPGRGGRDDRCGPDPATRHARRQHRQRLAGGRHAAGPAGRRCHVRPRLGAWRARGPRRRLLDRLSAGPPSPTTSSSCASGSRSVPDREMRFRKVGTRRAQSISKVVLAVAWRSAGEPWTGGRPGGARLGRGRRPSGRRPRRPCSRARSPTPETADRAAETLAGRAPARSTTCARPPATGGSSPRASSIASCARPAAGDGRDGRPRPTADELAPLFEGAPPSWPGSWRPARSTTEADLFATARSIAHAMPEPEQVELIDAHPRLGAPPGSVSAMSFHEQGYDRGAGRAGGPPTTSPTALDAANDAYEARFGFRYCVFVDGRPREALLPGMTAALDAPTATPSCTAPSTPSSTSPSTAHCADRRGDDDRARRRTAMARPPSGSSGSGATRRRTACAT